MPAGRAPRTRAHLVIVDPRRFGTGELLLGSTALEEFFAARLGLEPFDERFTAEHLRALARGRSGADQGVAARPAADRRRRQHLRRRGAVPGAASTRCARPGGSPREQYAALRQAIIEALSAGIDARGATIDDFRHVDGVRGSFQDQFLVHRRAGEPCPRLRDDDRQDGRRGARHLRLRELPAATAASAAPLESALTPSVVPSEPPAPRC